MKSAASLSLDLFFPCTTSYLTSITGAVVPEIFFSLLPLNFSLLLEDLVLYFFSHLPDSFAFRSSTKGAKIYLNYFHKWSEVRSANLDDKMGENPKTLINQGFEVVTTKISLTFGSPKLVLTALPT